MAPEKYIETLKKALLIGDEVINAVWERDTDTLGGGFEERYRSGMRLLMDPNRKVRASGAAMIETCWHELPYLHVMLR